MNQVTIDNLLNIYNNEISKNVKNRKSLYEFEINKMQNIGNIIEMLKSKNIGHSKYNIFLIYEPKCRLVMSLGVKDKIINHFITRYFLETKLTKYLDIRNCATRKNMGTFYAIKLVKKYIEENKKYEKFYILKMDLTKYFYNINHVKLKELLIDKLDSYEYELVSKIIDSTNQEYINNCIDKFKKRRNVDIPFYESGKGLPIGNMTSQFLSIFYLYPVDHYIIHDLKLKCYVRYMDDFIIMSPDLEKLKIAKIKIKKMIEEEFKIKVNDKKTMITSSNEAFSFLGYTFKVINHKTIIHINKRKLNNIKLKIKKVSYKLKNKKVEYNRVFSTIMTYQNLYQFTNNIRLQSIINRYFFNEK